MESEIMKDYNMFSDCWKLYRELVPPHPLSDERYWESVVQKAHEVVSRYPSKLCKDILVGITRDLEKKSKRIV